MTNSHAFTHIHTDRYIATWLPSQQGDTSIMSHNYYLFFCGENIYDLLSSSFQVHDAASHVFKKALSAPSIRNTGLL